MLLNSSVHQTGTRAASVAAKSPVSISAASIANELQSNLNLIDGKKSASPTVMSSSLTSEPDANNNTLSKAKRIMDTTPITSSSSARSQSQQRQQQQQFSAKSVEDESYFAEEDKGDCVYVITYKKVYNKGLGTPRPSYGQLPNVASSLYSEQQPVNPYGTYRLLTPQFSPYQEGDQQSTASASGANCGDGLVYSRVKIKQLKYASLVKFIEHFTSEDTGELDSNLAQTFLATYRTFTDTQTVLKLLKQRYEQILPASLDMTEDVRLESLRSIKAFVRLWLESYGEDFAEPPDYPNLNELNRFAHSHLNDAEIIKVIRAKFEQFESSNEAATGTSETAAATTILEDKNNRKINGVNLAAHILPTREKLIMSDNVERTVVSNHRRSYSNLAQPSQASLTSSRINSNHSRSQVSLDPASMSKLMLFSSPSSNLDDNNNSSSMSSAAASLLGVDCRFIAEQLTYVDKKLFQRIYAYHCLASVWGTRYQKTNNPATSHQKSNSGSSAAELTQSTASTQSAQGGGVGGLITPALADKFASMRAFIDQFNLVSFVVQGTILEKFDLKPVERAKIINKWIEIALECRKLKNFSSLNAIVQGLNTQCVSRLVKTWNEVAPDLKMQFNQLTEMFSQDQNQKIFREILMKDLNEYKELFGSNDNISNINNNNKINFNNSQMEGTAKYAEIESGINATLSRKMKEKMMQKKNYESRFKEPIGTVPFLGTFLKDLEYINAKNYQKNEKGLINVVQKKREFEIIAQIKLLQQASYLYSMKPDENFEKWLGSLPIYSEVQNYELSYMIEPKFDRDVSSNSSGSNPRKIKNGFSQGSRSESVDSISSSNPATNGSHSKTPSSVTRNQFKNGGVMGASGGGVGGGGIGTPLSTHGASGVSGVFPGHLHSRNSSMGSASDMVGPGAGDPVKSSLIDSTPSDNQSTNTSAASVDAAFNSKYYGTIGNGKSIDSSSEKRVKVNMDTGDHAGTVMYKKMSINDKYRTKDVKRLILEKFFLNPDHADKYTLIQMLGGGKELVINDNCNVFYAAKDLPDMQFVLRAKNSAMGGLSSMSSTLADSAIPNGGNANGGLQHQAKYMRHSFANLNQANSSQQSQSKSSRWWLKKILS